MYKLQKLKFFVYTQPPSIEFNSNSWCSVVKISQHFSAYFKRVYTTLSNLNLYLLYAHSHRLWSVLHANFQGWCDWCKTVKQTAMVTPLFAFDYGIDMVLRGEKWRRFEFHWNKSRDGKKILCSRELNPGSNISFLKESPVLKQINLT